MPPTSSNLSSSTIETPKSTIIYTDSTAVGHSQQKQPINSAKQTPLPKPIPTKTKTLCPDTRLFVRITPDHKAYKASYFALFIYLKYLLRDYTYLLIEVQVIKSGFALCIAFLEDLTSLKTHIQTIIKVVLGYITIKYNYNRLVTTWMIFPSLLKYLIE